MAAEDRDGTPPTLYQLLGVPREASREEIALAWRRRAREEHPDARPADADAPGRFRAAAEAWRVLGDPARRAAYDRALGRPPQAAAGSPPAPGSRVPVRHVRGSAGGRPLTGTAPPPLRAGPVRVEAPGPAASAPLSAEPAPPEPEPAPAWAEEEIRLAILAELMLRRLGRRW